jgi:hypothetical protein
MNYLNAISLYDLPDLAASLAPRRLLIFYPTDGFGESADYESINEDLSIIRSGYQHKGAGHNLIINNEPFNNSSLCFYIALKMNILAIRL